MSDFYVIVSVVVVVFVSIYVCMASIFRAIGSQSRYARVVGQGAETGGEGGASVPTRLTAAVLTLANVADRVLKLGSSTGATTTRTKLFQAGFKEGHHLAIYFLIKYAGTSLIFFVTLAFELMKSQNWALSGQASLLVCGASLGFFLGIDLCLNKKIEGRNRNVSEALPDCLDLLVVCTEAGLSLDAALQRVSSELSRQYPIISEELRTTVLELGFLPERRLALENLSSRIADDSVQTLVTTLVQSERYGTPLAHALRVISNEIRDKRIMKAEEKAARLPAVLTVPMIVFILPTLFIVLAGPAFIQVYDTMK